MTIPFVNNYTVGKGRLYFNRFVTGTKAGPGFKYFGNTPTLTLLRTVTSLDHFDSDDGIKIKDDSIDIQVELGGKFTCDNITNATLALFMGADDDEITQVAGTSSLTESFAVMPDSYYQLGVVADTNPQGLQQTGSLVVTQGTSAIASSLYDYYPDSGWVHTSPSITAATWTFSYELTATTGGTIIEAGEAIYGQLMFKSNNPKGLQRDYFYPYVKLSADAEMSLKADTWMVASFGYEALTLDSLTQRCYITQRAN